MAGGRAGGTTLGCPPLQTLWKRVHLRRSGTYLRYCRETGRVFFSQYGGWERRSTPSFVSVRTCLRDVKSAGLITALAQIETSGQEGPSPPAAQPRITWSCAPQPSHCPRDERSAGRLGPYIDDGMCEGPVWLSACLDCFISIHPTTQVVPIYLIFKICKGPLRRAYLPGYRPF